MRYTAGGGSEVGDTFSCKPACELAWPKLEPARCLFPVHLACFCILLYPTSPVAAQTSYGEPRQLARLANPMIAESSGVAASRREQGLFWTHNDSGDRPRVFAFDRTGRSRGEVRLVGAAAVDWEDMASFIYEGKPHLVLADVGDNLKLRNTSTLYVITEPTLAEKEVRVRLSIPFRFSNGPENCEAVGWDTATNSLFLIAKSLLNAGVYTLPLPEDSPSQPLVAERIARVSLPMVTALDFSPDGRRCVVLTYGHAYEFVRQADEGWRDAFRKRPREITMPPRRQGEAICYGFDGRTLYLTSEGKETPLWEVPFPAH